MNILLVKGITQYEVLNFFIDELAKEFEKLGHNVYNCTLTDASQLQLEIIQRANIELVVNMNAMYTGIWNKLLRNQDCLIWNFFVDHPMYLISRINQLWDNQISSFVDYEHIEYVKKYFPHMRNLIYMPHAGLKSLRNIEYSDRKFDVVFMGSYTEIQSFSKEFSKYSDDMQNVFYKVSEQMSLGQGTLDELFLNEMIKRGVIIEKDEVPNITEELIFLDKFVRNFNRVAMIEEVAKNNIHIDIYGNGWEKYDNQYPEYIRIHKAISFDETINIMSNAKIVLNNMPLFRNGSHERVFTSMLCGALCISEKNVYLDQQFESNEDIVFFTYDRLSELPEKILYYLANQNNANRIARNAFNKVNSKHTWFQRANQILEAYFKFRTEKSNKRLVEKDTIDMKFNQVIQFVENNSQDQLYELIKAQYIELSRINKAVLESMEASYKNYPYWGKLSMKNKEYELIEQRAFQLKEHLDDFIWLYQKVQDSTSRKILCNILYCWITFDSSYLNEILDNRFSQYFDRDIIQCDDQEVFVDIGAYNGDTLLSYLNNFVNYKKVICYELDKKNFSELLSVTNSFENIEAKNYAVGEEHGKIIKVEIEDMRSESSRINKNYSMSNNFSCSENIQMVSIDEDIHEKITFLKMDVEGAERYILNGARRHISIEKPKLAVCIYHGNEDIWKIPRIIDSLNDSYKFYIRYYGGNLYPNEIVLYAV